MTLKRSFVRALPWAGLLAFAAALRLALVFGLGTLWADEAFSWHFARMPFMEMLGLLRYDVHPPFHAALLWLWMRLFGDAAVAVRLLSFFTALAGLAAFKFLGLRLYGKRVAFIALAAASLSPLMLYYGADGRMYALVFFLSCFSGLAFWELLNGNARAREFWTFSSMALVMTHLTGALVIAAQGAFLLSGKDRRETFLRLFPRFAMLGGLFLVWFVPAFLRRASTLGAEWQFQAGADALPLHEALAYWFWVPASSGALAASAAALGLFLVGGLFRHSKRPPHFNLSDRSLFLLFWLAFTTLPFLASGASVTPRYLAAAAPPAFLLVAHGVMNVSRRRWEGVALSLAALVFLTLPGIAAQISDRPYNWDIVAEWIGGKWTPGDRIIFGWYANRLPFEAAGGFDGKLKNAEVALFYPFDDKFSWDERYVAHAGTLAVSENELASRLEAIFPENGTLFFLPAHFLRLDDGSSAAPRVVEWLEKEGWLLLDHLPDPGRIPGVWMLRKDGAVDKSEELAL